VKERVIVAVIFVPILFIVLFFLPAYVFTAVVVIVCAVSAYELQHKTGIKPNDRISIYVAFSAAIIPIGAYFGVVAHVFMAVFLILMCLMFIEAVFVFNKKKPITFAQIMTALFAGALIPYMLSCLVSLKTLPEGRLFVLLPVITAFLTDAGAYFTGVIFGKHRAFPSVSPKKTVEGFIGGIVIGTAAMVIYGVIIVFTTLHRVEFWAIILYGFIGAMLTELGDLAFSLIKREYEIKDYGRLFPGHGGMLDRFDSTVFAAPAIYLMVMVMPAIIIRGA